MTSTKFPVIKHINDVLPHIEGKKEFTVGVRDGYQFIDYNVAMEDTFDTPMLRECRGIKFYPDGRIMARPPHKFFNLNERPETALDALPWETEWQAFTKLDGSLIHPGYIYDGDMRIVPMTKRGYTSVAELCEEECILDADNGDFLLSWWKEALEAGCTPFFEYTSPNNRIVVKYDEPKLTLLGVRNNETGEYWDTELHTELAPWTMHESKDVFIKHVQQLRGEEGVVIRFNSGQDFVKLKAEEYVLMHRAKDQILLEKNRIAMFLENKMDDIIPLLSEEDREMLWADFHRFIDHRARVKHGVQEYVRHCKRMFPNNRKAFAIENCREQPKSWQGLCFAAWDGKLDAALEKLYRRGTSSQTNYDGLVKDGLLPSSE